MESAAAVEPAAAVESAATAQPPRDDLFVALLSMQGLAPGAEAEASRDAESLRVVGCRRLTELVHNQPAHKLEALDRGAMVELRTLFETQTGSPELILHAARAVRSLSFKNENGREHVHRSGIIKPMATSLAVCIDLLASQADGAARAGAEPTTPVLLEHALGAVDELLLALTAACNSHELNAGAAKEAGVPALAEGLVRLVPSLSSAAAAAASARPAAKAPQPSQLAQKAKFLLAVLE